eukprot:scaffold65357_cov73-Phaeocystis_antarctica.AAC.1
MERFRLKAAGARARAERTRNMPVMSVTLDVLKLSGWLNAYANCRVEWGRGERYGPGGVRALGVAATHPRGGTDSRRLWGPGHARSARRTCTACP